LCAEVHQECTGLLNLLPQLAPFANCTGTGLLVRPTAGCNGSMLDDGAENFPVNSTQLAVVEFNNASVPLVSQCNAFEDSFPANASSVLVCPAPLVRSVSPLEKSTIEHGSCAVPCPSILFTPAETRDSDAFFTALTVLSFLTSSLLLATWSVFPSKRKQSNTLMMNFCTWCLSVVMLISVISTGGQPSTQPCLHEASFRAQRDGGYCVFEAVALFEFSLAGCLFWFVSAVDLYVKIVLMWYVPFASLACAMGNALHKLCFSALTFTTVFFAFLFFPVVCMCFLSFLQGDRRRVASEDELGIQVSRLGVAKRVIGGRIVHRCFRRQGRHPLVFLEFRGNQSNRMGFVLLPCPLHRTGRILLHVQHHLARGEIHAIHGTTERVVARTGPSSDIRGGVPLHFRMGVHLPSTAVLRSRCNRKISTGLDCMHPDACDGDIRIAR
jgi:hypothetical protein